MASYLNTNMASLIAQNNLSNSQTSLTTSIQRLSSGLRINSAADDAAGYAIAQNMTTQINGNAQAANNASNGVSLAQTAQGDLGTILANLQTISGLAVEAANATNTSADRAALNDQVQQLLQENNRIAQSSNFNGVNLLDGSFQAQTFQVGANNNSADQISVSGIPSMLTSQMGNVTTGATVPGGKTTAALTAGQLTLNGVQVGASVAGTSAGQTADSAYSIAQAINAVESSSGVNATANAATVSGTATATTSGAAGALVINGISIGAIAAGGTATGEAANVAAAINLVSSETGVTATASASGAGITLTAADGRDITVTSGTGWTAGFGVASGTTTGSLTLTSSSSAGITISGSLPGNAGLASGTTAASSQLNSLSKLDVLTVTDATNAMTTIQAAINQVTTAAAQMGAYQNRFSAVVTGIQTDSQNLTQSLATIQDTNYASETANLSRLNILSQAGNAMLAQANQLPAQILTLLR